MNHTEEYSDQKLQDMKELCTALTRNILKTHWEFKAIVEIALVEINRELDERKIERKEQNE